MKITDIVRLNKESRETLSKYNDDTDKAIKAMAVRIDGLERDMAKNLSVTDALQQAGKHWTNTGPVGGHDDIFWNKLRDVVTKALQEKPKSNEFVTASKLVATPVKTFGKIDEEDQYVEPVGRQGREIK